MEFTAVLFEMPLLTRFLRRSDHREEDSDKSENRGCQSDEPLSLFCHETPFARVWWITSRPAMEVEREARNRNSLSRLVILQTILCVVAHSNALPSH